MIRLLIVTLTVATPFVVLQWWVMGALGGFHLWERLPRQAKRWLRIYGWLTLLTAGGAASVATSKGCVNLGQGQATAVAKYLEGGVPVAGKAHSLGNVAPPQEFLTRLKAVTAKQEKLREAESRVRVVQAIADAMTFRLNHSSTVGLSRKGPFCHVTCMVHHGSTYDRETLPEFCRANWIPPDAHAVPGWYPLNDTMEYTAAWPGPADGGFDNYKLYWTEK